MQLKALDFEGVPRRLLSLNAGGMRELSQPWTCRGQTAFDRLAFATLWFFVFTVPFEKSLLIGSSSVSRLVGALMAPVVVFALASRGWLLPLVRTDWAIIAFTAWVALSYLWTVWPGDTVDRLSTHLQLLILVLVIRQVCLTKKSVRHVAMAYVLGTLVSCWGTFTQFAAHETSRYGRYSGEGFDPNDLGLAFALSVPVSYYLFIRSRGWTGIVWLLQIGAVSVACLLTASRMAAIVLVLALTIVPVTASALNPRKLGILVIGLIMAAGCCVIFTPHSSWDRLSTITGELTAGTLDSRTEVWASGLTSFTTAPILGVGAGAFKDAVSPLLSFYDESHAYVAHNTFISVLTELGLVGMALFLAIFAGVCGAAAGIRPALERNMWIVTLMVWTAGVFTLTWEHMKPTWILFALVLQARAVTENEPEGQAVRAAAPHPIRGVEPLDRYRSGA